MQIAATNGPKRRNKITRKVPIALMHDQLGNRNSLCQPTNMAYHVSNADLDGIHRVEKELLRG